jgi:hypothetical protein
MKHNSHRTFVPFAAAALALLVLFTSACNLHLGTYTQVIEITLNDELLAQGQPSFTVPGHRFPDAFDCMDINDFYGINIHDCLEEFDGMKSHNFWDEFDGVDIQRMELHDGFIRLLGTCAGREGGSDVCSFDVRLSATDGRLVSEIIAVDVPGLNLDDLRILRINQNMQVQLFLEGIDAGAKVLFQDVTVTEKGIDLSIEVTFSL